MIPREIIRAYDIRGKYGVNLNEEIAKEVGIRFGTFIKNTQYSKNNTEKIFNVVVGRDGRNHSPSLKEALVLGIRSCSINIIDIGIVPTPILWFAIKTIENADAGIMVTASHNPPSDNGFKMTLKNDPITEEDLLQIYNVDKRKFAASISTVKEIDMQEIYIKRVLKNALFLNKKLKIIFDPGNGATCNIIKKLSKILPFESKIINGDMDGNFPNHPPDPTIKENMKDLIDEVIKNKADVGIAFDGDGDRIGIVDDQGNHWSGDELTTLFAMNVLKENKGRFVIGDVKSSSILQEIVEKFGGKFVRCRTGHSFIKRKVNEIDAVLAGEMSGHIFFKDDYYGFDDSIYAAIRLLRIIDRSDIKLSEIRSNFPKTFPTSEIKIFCKDENKKLFMAEVKKAIEENSIEYSEVDGIRVDTDYGWWLIRSSHTQPYIVGRVEGKTAEARDKIIKQFNEYSLYGVKSAINQEALNSLCERPNE